MMNIDLQKLKTLLPATPGILQKEEYFNAAVLIPLIKINDEYNLLFEKRSAGIRQGSEICFPGGEIDKEDEGNFQRTAIRETSEELGINRDSINIIGQLDTLVGPMGVTVDSFIGEIYLSSLDELKIDINEVEKIFAIPLSFFLDTEPETYYLRMEIHPTITEEDGTVTEIFPAKTLALPERYWQPWQVPKREVYVYKTTEGTIWGITAILIKEVIAKLKSII